MKRIGLLSDTHSWWDDKYTKHFADCDEIWHAGDIGSMDLALRFEAFKPFRAVYGNIDDSKVRAAYPEFLRFTLEGVDVLMTHIGGYPGKYDPRVRNILLANPPKLFICGHSHILKVMFDKKLNCLHINPGAAGKYGFHTVRTLVKFDLDAGNITNLNVIELND
ncbi:putative phosphoesterase [Dysgonomonas sp. PFB1-18]|uniref:metallophosphoesterase family protein n=1 Tax=unclassified Dysgonomonas TaxID=2630389 RepID=UPI0024735EA8|nr:MULTISPECIES: metallophosphoesterase family protein [unclassified Dysgonomonas]MDH6308342.1 putative phosphoesterase [Dysgonomonas sp. PF1-14]MDH6338221.1 putative phosphoesterase [Dysgonomonas sp. PF1-16]MDH6379718.1 putative phosphoesterase [Dysgonomonas sp. PFB1-18]MDH6397193.1 putative phosphoesterase [Dysgonomonas sp. PF1-23]